MFADTFSVIGNGNVYLQSPLNIQKEITLSERSGLILDGRVIDEKQTLLAINGRADSI